jgi:hypothetical protein
LSLSAFAQPEVSKTNEKNDSKTETENPKPKDSKEKSCNQEEPKKPLIKKDLEPLTEELEALKLELISLKKTIQALPAAIDSQYTKVKELESANKKYLETNETLTKEKGTLTGSLNKEKQKTLDVELEKDNLSKTLNENYEAYDKMANDFVIHSKSPNNTTIDLMKNQLAKSGAFLGTRTKLDEFKKQSNALQAAIILIKSEDISKEEFQKAQNTLANLISNTEFLGLQESAITVKTDYDRFIELGLELEEVIKADEVFTNPKYREDKVYEDFEKHIAAIKPYPFLVSKYKEALKDPKCSIGFPLK